MTVRTLYNTDVYERIWPHLQKPDGSTVQLAPGESCEVDVPDDMEDDFLKPVVQGKSTKTDSKPVPAPTEEPKE